MRVDVGPSARLNVTGHARPMMGLEGVGNQRLDAELECLGERVPEHLRGRLIPENYPLGLRIRNDDRVPDPLEEAAEPEVFRSHASSCSHASTGLWRHRLQFPGFGSCPVASSRTTTQGSKT